MQNTPESDCVMCDAVRRLCDLVCEYADLTKDIEAGALIAGDESALLQAYGDKAAKLLHEGVLTTIGNFFMEVEFEDSGMSQIIGDMSGFPNH